VTSTRLWGGGQSWSRNTPAKPTHASTRRR
jgi:hypothetical protein